MAPARMTSQQETDFAGLNVDFEREGFFGQIVRQLSKSLQDIVGLAEAEGFMALAASHIGDDISEKYRKSLNVPALSQEQLSAVLVDLKGRIGGQFEIEYEDDSVIVLRNSACPFGAGVHGHPALCMMTTNVFGRIAANSMGYAHVNIDKAIANGDSHCRVVVHLKPPQDAPQSGKEFFGPGSG